MNPQKVINVVVIAIILLAVSGVGYSLLAGYITNITGSSYCVPGTIAATCNGTVGYGTITAYSNTLLLTVISGIYWILISAGIVLYFIKTFKVTK